MVKKSATATEETSDLHRLISIAIKASNSPNGIDRCFDILGYLKRLSFSGKDLVRLSKEISPLASLRDHGNPRIRMAAKDLFTSWMKTLYSRGSSTYKKPETDHVVKVCPCLKKKKKKVTRSVTETKEKTEHQRFKVLEVCVNNAGGQKKQSSLPRQLSENPRTLAHEAAETKDKKSVQKNSAETLEMFEIAKKSADVASAKGVLLSTKETSICVDTLSLLIDYPISSTAPETKRIMEKLAYLTKHKDRKICNSATALLQHWSQSITDQLQNTQG